MVALIVCAPVVASIVGAIFSIRSGRWYWRRHLILAFCDIGLNNIAVSALLAATIGLALAQSVSRTSWTKNIRTAAIAQQQRFGMCSLGICLNILVMFFVNGAGDGVWP